VAGLWWTRTTRLAASKTPASMSSSRRIIVVMLKSIDSAVVRRKAYDYMCVSESFPVYTSSCTLRKAPPSSLIIMSHQIRSEDGTSIAQDCE
jgi:hypothetical protein